MEHQFEIHINIREKPSTGVIRGMGVGGKHLAVTADTNGRTIIHHMRHLSILREIISLQSIRTRKGKRRKRNIEKQITQLRQKANNITNDYVNRVIHAITKDADKVVLEDLSYEFTSSGILCTNHINCRDQLCVNLDTGELIRFITEINQSWREPEKSNEPLDARESRRRVPPESSTKVEALGIELVAVPARYTSGRFTRPTSQTCHVCGHVGNKSRSTETHSICNQEFHADINAAFSNRFPCMGRQSVSSGGGDRSPPNRRRQGGNNGDKRKSCSQRLMVTAIQIDTIIKWCIRCAHNE